MFKPGNPRPANAGRKKGTPNKRTLLKVDEVLARNHVNPIEEIIRLLPELSARDQVKVHLELMQYCVPKLKASEVEDDSEKDVTPTGLGEISTEQLLDEVTK